jgi:hypothetical protein
MPERSRSLACGENSATTEQGTGKTGGRKIPAGGSRQAGLERPLLRNQAAVTSVSQGLICVGRPKKPATGCLVQISCK